ncbi:hypothetical protein CWO85_01490 [Candidatus Phytoplasma ziziphi]|uniref:Uncharacterized protein n=1 Tax=Ziziphus jujuba witches'-broom phytoplasma TaxID=135727 RepID=A0A660HMV2_ZIZJU|nr:hypothetical protein [Candidatus Phytoplasma ziziphi]AYJ01199.1 hypothetical protein CWO85_01490 [Candidatus Phytoplasma ziziphi]
MNNNNFFKKYLAIIIIIIAVFVGIGIYYKTNNSLKQEQQEDPNSEFFKKNPTTKVIKELIDLREREKNKLNDISSNPLCREDLKKEILEILKNNNCIKENIINMCRKTDLFNSFSKKEQEDFVEKRYITHLNKDIENLTNTYNKLPHNFLYKKIISPTNFKKIKTYILSETDDKSLLPNNLSQEEKIKIDEIRKSQEYDLGILKKWNSKIEKEQQECDDFHLKIKEIQDKFPSLKSQQTKLEQDKEAKNQTIQNLQYQCGEINPSYAIVLKRRYNIEIQNPKTPNKVESERLQALIDKLQTEKSKIIGEIEKIELQIGKLENKQSSLTEQLELAETFKKGLKEKLNNLSEKFKDLTISTLQSLYEIASAEE